MPLRKKSRGVLVATNLEPEVHQAFKEKVRKERPRTSQAGMLELLVLRYIQALK